MFVESGVLGLFFQYLVKNVSYAEYYLHNSVYFLHLISLTALVDLLCFRDFYYECDIITRHSKNLVVTLKSLTVKTEKQESTDSM